MKTKDLKKASNAELEKYLKDLRLELMKEQGNVEMGGNVKNPGKIRVIKKSIAKILTIQTERKK